MKKSQQKMFFLSQPELLQALMGHLGWGDIVTPAPSATTLSPPLRSDSEHKGGRAGDRRQQPRHLSTDGASDSRRVSLHKQFASACSRWKERSNCHSYRKNA